jgi:hypothetical protein
VAICLARDINTPGVSFASHCAYKHYATHFIQESPTNTTFADHLLKACRQLHKDLFAERMAEIWRRAWRNDCAKVTAALTGGSTKHLVNPLEFITNAFIGE